MKLISTFGASRANLADSPLGDAAASKRFKPSAFPKTRFPLRMLVMLSFALGAKSLASPIELKAPTAPTLPPASTRDLAEKEVALPNGSAPAKPGTAVVFPDFSQVNNETQSSSTGPSNSKICRRDGHTYKPGDVMYASCTSQNEVEQAMPRNSHGKSHGASTGSDSASF